MVLRIDVVAHQPAQHQHARDIDPIVGPGIEHRIMVAQHHEHDGQSEIIVVQGALLGLLPQGRVGGAAGDHPRRRLALQTQAAEVHAVGLFGEPSLRTRSHLV